ncbi:MAG TPA: hypothetical protein VIL20_10350 [Sandaracinaceae bacterium]
MTIDTSGDLRGWFRERLAEALERRRVPASEPAQVYLVELLTGFATDPDTADLARPLALQLAEAVEATGVERIRRLRALGDAALYLAGFFADHLHRRGVSRRYFMTMGERAYSSASALAAYSPSEAARSPVYSELAGEFEGFVETLDDVRESTALRTPQDIVKLYDRWRRTRSPRLAERLREEGVFPIEDPSGGRTLH